MDIKVLNNRYREYREPFRLSTLQRAEPTTELDSKLTSRVLWYSPENHGYTNQMYSYIGFVTVICTIERQL
jgi:hypothetical protein